MNVQRQLAGTLIAGLTAWLASGAGLAAQKSKGPTDPQRVTRIEPVELKKLLAKGQAVLVDVRSAQAYERGHLDGALSIPAAEIEAKAAELRRRAGSRTVVLYCSCPFEYSAANAAVTLARLGLTRVAVLTNHSLSLHQDRLGPGDEAVAFEHPGTDVALRTGEGVGG
jgi:rhodanese-related sulfurtransferase